MSKNENSCNGGRWEWDDETDEWLPPRFSSGEYTGLNDMRNGFHIERPEGWEAPMLAPMAQAQIGRVCRYLFMSGGRKKRWCPFRHYERCEDLNSPTFGEPVCGVEKLVTAIQQKKLRQSK